MPPWNSSVLIDTSGMNREYYFFSTQIFNNWWWMVWSGSRRPRSLFYSAAAKIAIVWQRQIIIMVTRTTVTDVGASLKIISIPSLTKRDRTLWLCHSVSIFLFFTFYSSRFSFDYDQITRIKSSCPTIRKYALLFVYDELKWHWIIDKIRYTY